MGWDDGYRRSVEVLSESFSVMESVLTHAQDPEQLLATFNRGYGLERDGWALHTAWKDQHKRVPTKYALGQKLFQRETLRLLMASMLLRGATRLRLTKWYDESAYELKAGLAKEQAGRSLIQLREAPALRSRHLLEAASVKEAMDAWFNAVFVPSFNETADQYNTAFDDTIPVYPGE